MGNRGVWLCVCFLFCTSCCVAAQQTVAVNSGQYVAFHLIGPVTVGYNCTVVTAGGGYIDTLLLSSTGFNVLYGTNSTVNSTVAAPYILTGSVQNSSSAAASGISLDDNIYYLVIDNSAAGTAQPSANLTVAYTITTDRSLAFLVGLSMFVTLGSSTFFLGALATMVFQYVQNNGGSSVRPEPNTQTSPRETDDEVVKRVFQQTKHESPKKAANRPPAPRAQRAGSSAQLLSAEPRLRPNSASIYEDDGEIQEIQDDDGGTDGRMARITGNITAELNEGMVKQRLSGLNDSPSTSPPSAQPLVETSAVAPSSSSLHKRSGSAKPPRQFPLTQLIERGGKRSTPDAPDGPDNV